MSPGATFERVYNELKRMLAEGELPPGTPIEPTLIGKQIASSITPIRDALHRLTGERLVEAPNHNGFRVPLPTEAALRDLYEWNTQLVVLAARHIRAPVAVGAGPGVGSGEGAGTATARLFAGIAHGGGSAEHARAVEQLNDRLAPFRRIEGKVLGGLAEEHRDLALYFSRGERAPLIRLLDRYSRRRLSVTPRLLAAVMA